MLHLARLPAISASFLGLGSNDKPIKSSVDSLEDVQAAEVASKFDRANVSEEEEAIAIAYADRSRLHWQERLKLMFRKDNYGQVSPELDTVIQATKLSTFVGLCIGAYVDSKEEYKRFMVENKHEMFKHPREAQMALMDRMVISMGKGAFKLGWRMCLMTGIFMTVSTSLTVARNAINPLDQLVGGATMGALWRLFGGPRGMLVGGAVGGTLGLGAGAVSWGAQYVQGETVEERWRREFQFGRDLSAAKMDEQRKKQEEIVPRVKWTAVEGEEEEEEEEKDILPVRIVLKIRELMGV